MSGKFDFISFGAASDKGAARPNNEDSFMLLGSAGCFAVADGMGGGEAGEIASQIIVGKIKSAMEGSESESPGERKCAFKDALISANSEIAKYMSSRGFSLMGSTVVGFISDSWNPSIAHICHIGDSRVYCLRLGELFRITSDHTLGAELAIKSPKDKIPAHLNHILTRCISGGSSVNPEWNTISVCENDVFLVCSDGVPTMLGDQEIRALLSAGEPPDAAAKKIVDSANERGGFDNITAIVLKISDKLPPKEKVSEIDVAESELLLNVAERH